MLLKTNLTFLGKEQLQPVNNLINFHMVQLHKVIYANSNSDKSHLT